MKIIYRLNCRVCSKEISIYEEEGMVNYSHICDVCSDKFLEAMKEACKQNTIYIGEGAK